MGFLDFLKGIGNFVKSGVQRVAGWVGKLAPVVSKVAGLIPTPLTQGIAQAANLAGGVAGAINGTEQQPPQTPAGTTPAPDASQQVPPGTAPPAQTPPAAPAGPIM
jgi:hypothetical protein